MWQPLDPDWPLALKMEVKFGWGLALLFIASFYARRWTDWWMGGTPIWFQIIGQMFACILQLIFIQNYIECILQKILKWDPIPILTGGHWANFSAATIWTFIFLVWLLPRVLTSLWSTFGELILMKTWIGANDVLANWLGWFIVSQSNTTNCIERENSKIRSISAWISAKNGGKNIENIQKPNEPRELLDRELALSIWARFVGLLSNDRFASEMSAVTRVMIILAQNKMELIPKNTKIPSLETMLQIIEYCFLHHIRHLISLQWRAHQHHWTHCWHHIVGGNILLLKCRTISFQSTKP